jgi:archaellum component FlaC
MSADSTATRKNIDDVLNVLDIMMTRIDERFTKLENNVESMQKQLKDIQNHLDSLEKRMEISEDERLVMAHQLTRIHEWIDQAAKRIDIKFAH